MAAAMSRIRYVVALLLLFLSLTAPQSAQAITSYSGHVTIARATDDALLLWVGRNKGSGENEPCLWDTYVYGH